MTCNQAINHFGSVAKLAAKIGYNRRAVYHWKAAGRIPPKAQRLIQAATRGKLKAGA